MIKQIYIFLDTEKKLKLNGIFSKRNVCFTLNVLYIFASISTLEYFCIFTSHGNIFIRLK